MNSFNVGGNLLTFDVPRVMGILNVTQDSFYDGGRYTDLDSAMTQIDKMLTEGADIIDVGAFSSRPGAELVNPDEQLRILVPVIKEIINKFPSAILSIDTYSAKVVDQLSQYCSFVVNDISGYQWDDQLLVTVAEKKLPYILMHMKGTPANMMDNIQYDNVVMHVLDRLATGIHHLRQLGIEQIMVDPGIGFAKGIEHNFQLIKDLQVLQILDLPVLVGLSRKSFIYKTLNVSSEEALNGTTAMHMVALNNGAKILRAHDVKEDRETIKLWQQLHNPVN